MPEGQPEGPRGGEEKFEANSNRAEAMAYEMNADTTLANNADKMPGLEALAAELLQTADQLGKEAGQIFDRDELAANQWVAQQAIATSVFINDGSRDTLKMLGGKNVSPALELAIYKFYGLVGAKPPTHEARQLAASDQTALINPAQLGLYVSERWQKDESGTVALTMELSKQEPQEQ